MSAALPQSRLEELEAENSELRARLADAEQTLEAIRGGHIDALVIDGPEGQRIFSLAGAERPYRALIEQMQEGAVTLSNDGSIQYCNKAFADLLKRLACHGSVRVGRVLATGEISALLAELDATPFKSNCPHGRPVHIRFARGQIERLFRR